MLGHDPTAFLHTQGIDSRILLDPDATVPMSACVRAGRIATRTMGSPAEVRFAHRAPPDYREHERFFAAPLLFVVLFLALNTLGVPLPVLGAAAGGAFGPISGGLGSRSRSNAPARMNAPAHVLMPTCETR